MDWKKISILAIALVVLVMSAVYMNRDQVRGIRERGKLEAEPEINVELENGETETVMLEDYVAGVVAGEMKKGWPTNAYAAQAIIARTFALKFMEENETNTISGSFKFAQEYKPENIDETVKDAVQKTRGEVALYRDEYITAWFHASAGGETTTAKVGLAFEDEEPPYIKVVESPDQEAPEDVRNWVASFTNEEIENTLQEMGENIGSLEEIEVVDKDRTGRVIDFEFTGTEGLVIVKAANFRRELDTLVLKSTKIEEITKEEGGYTFKGTGYGHGVGMSQWGAYAMGKDNQSPEDIVLYYFDGIEIAKVYD